jgi:hypothetical protein
MSDAEVYLDEWLASAPEMELALLFCPPSSRRRVALWGALQRALDHAAFELSEPSVAQAKLGWWSDELARGASGAARHPLAREWFAQPGTQALDARQWAALAQHALAVALDDRTPGDVDGALRRYLPYAEALAAAESAVFGGRSQASDLAIERLLRQLDRPAHGQAWPLQLLARHQVTRAEIDDTSLPGLRRDLAGALLERWPRSADATAHRRMRQALDRWRLRQWQGGRDRRLPGPLARLWLLWRAARPT